tara:strand:- start:613 stop:2388 length:1776 start_codon:yes stop_codon:yes gene_type:complete
MFPRLPIILAISIIITLISATNLPPYGHRVYTYQPSPSGLVATFNALAGPSNATVSTVNAYGGWFSRSTTKASIHCKSKQTPTNSSKRRFLIKNTEATSVTILSCAQDHCKHDEYVHCSGSVAGNGMNTVVTMDDNIHFMILLYNASYTQECWPKEYGTFPNLQLPLSPTACAQVPSGPNPQLPGPADAVVHLEPGHTTSKPSTDIDAFANIQGVEHITLVFDGRMDLCVEYDQYNMSNRVEFPCQYAPNLINISSNALDTLAAEVATVACNNPFVSGVQIDLEPLAFPWRSSTIDAIGKMATALKSQECRDATHPHGRYISTFTFAESVTPGLLTALGTNGVLAISGYDLYADNIDTRFNTPTEYGAKLQTQIEKVIKITGGVGDDATCVVPWVLGLPIAASAHEYKQYIPNPEHCGPACTPYDNGADMTEYMIAAFQYVRTRPDIFALNASTSCFRGFTFWKFDPVTEPKTGGGDYPPHSGNTWRPLGPSAIDLQVLKDQLGGGGGGGGGSGSSPTPSTKKKKELPLVPIVVGSAIGVVALGGIVANFTLRSTSSLDNKKTMEEQSNTTHMYDSMNEPLVTSSNDDAVQ